MEHGQAAEKDIEPPMRLSFLLKSHCLASLLRQTMVQWIGWDLIMLFNYSFFTTIKIYVMLFFLTIKKLGFPCFFFRQNMKGFRS